MLWGAAPVVSQVEGWDYVPESPSSRGHESFSFQIHGIPVNDPPSIVAPDGSAFRGREDTKLVLDAGGGIALADPDVSDTTRDILEMRITAGVGKVGIPLSSAGGLHVLSGDRETTEYWVRGELSALNRALQRLEYTGPQDWSGIDHLNLWVSDLGGTREEPPLEASRDFSIMIEEVGDSPRFLHPGVLLHLDEDTSVDGNIVGIRDPDPGEVVTVRIQSDHGRFSFPEAILKQGGPPNVTTSHAPAVGDGLTSSEEMRIRGLVEDVNFALNALIFRPPKDFVGRLVVPIFAEDTGNLSTEDFVYLYVRPINDPPVLRLPRKAHGTGPSVSIPAGGTGDAINGLLLSDVDVADSADLCSNMYSIEGRKVLSLKLIASHGFVSVRAGDATGVRVVGPSTAHPRETLHLQGSVSLLQEALDAGCILYRAPADFSGVDAILVEADDGGNCGEGGVGSTRGTLEVGVPPYNPPLKVEFKSCPSEEAMLRTEEDTALRLPDVVVSGGSVGERSAVDVVLFSVSGNLTLAQRELDGVELVSGKGKVGQRLHLRGSPKSLSEALTGIHFEPRPHFFGSWSRNDSSADGTPVRSPWAQGADALARVQVVGTPGGDGSKVTFERFQVIPNASWAFTAVKIFVGWVNDPPEVEFPRSIVARGFDESPVPGVHVFDVDIGEAGGCGGVLEVNVSSSAGGRLDVSAPVALRNGVWNLALSEDTVRLRGSLEHVNHVLATLTFFRAGNRHNVHRESCKSGDVVDTLLVRLSDLGSSGAGGEQRAEVSILVEAGSSVSEAVDGDTLALERVLPTVNTTEGSPVAIPGLDSRFSVMDGAERVTVALSAREGYLSLGPAGEGVAVAAGHEDWGPGVTLIETTGGAEYTRPEVQARFMGERQTCRSELRNYLRCLVLSSHFRV